MRVGFVGLGHMGVPMTARLVEAAHLVPRFDEPGGHRYAHVTEPDEADSHP